MRFIITEGALIAPKVKLESSALFGCQVLHGKGLRGVLGLSILSIPGDYYDIAIPNRASNTVGAPLASVAIKLRDRGSLLANQYAGQLLVRSSAGAANVTRAADGWIDT